MATSSIFTNVRITDPKKAEALIAAFEASEADMKNHKPENPTSIRYVDDPEEIRKIFASSFKNE